MKERCLYVKINTEIYIILEFRGKIFMKKINIVLLEPEIPQNTGNISRTAAVTGAALHIIKPMGFEVTDKHLKRAGLDYWDKLDITYYENYEDFISKNPEATLYFFSAKGEICYADVEYPETVFLVFGKESVGLPEELVRENFDRCLRIPMLPTLRCHNLSNSVAIAVYEVLRQRGFEGLISFRL